MKCLSGKTLEEVIPEYCLFECELLGKCPIMNILAFKDELTDKLVFQELLGNVN